MCIPNLVPLIHFIKWNYLLSTFREGCIICLSVKWTKTSTFSTPPIVESLTYYTTHYPLLVALLLSFLGVCWRQIFTHSVTMNYYSWLHQSMIRRAGQQRQQAEALWPHHHPSSLMLVGIHSAEARCSRNFQNVKLRLDFIEIWWCFCHSDFTWNQILAKLKVKIVIFGNFREFDFGF